MNATRHEIVFVDGMMLLLDGCGRRYAELEVAPGSGPIFEAKMKIDAWKLIYPDINATRAKRELTRYVAQF